MHSILVSILILAVVACGLPPAEVRAIKDQRYSMSLQKVATSEDLYHFQICRLAEEGQTSCFNPFMVNDRPFEFVGTPDLRQLQLRGTAKKTARYFGKIVLIGSLGAVALIVVPKAARYSLVKLFEMGKNGSRKGKVIERIAGEDELWDLAKRGKRWTTEDVDKVSNKYRIFESKWMKILISLFIVEGAFEGIDILYELYKYLDQGLAAGRWGDKELELFKVYPQLLSDQADEATVADLSRIAETLRKHLGVAFSDAYLMAFAGTTN